MKYKVGDKVRVKSIDWYEENKDDSGSIKIGSKEYYFVEEMLNYCGAPLTIKEVDSESYITNENEWVWTDGMFEDETIDEMFENNVPMSNTQMKISQVYDSLKDVVLYKNTMYGNSALEPLGIFAKDGSTSSILVRLDDKLQRIKNGSEIRKNDIADMIGYLSLLCVDKDWVDFSEFKD